ncbi:MAG: hypothetical protein IJ940_02760 [Bacteroidales bacterium]|nr:hypothetical protein [Bacteroidales bacterium]
MKYLYGASVQGIQDFIMKTNELKPIIGASELVDRICTSMFDEFTSRCKDRVENIVRAAGNIRVIFHSKDDCAEAYRNFPRKVMLAAPGITISQAVVCLEDDCEYAAAADELEVRLKVERNRPVRPLYPGLLGMMRAQKTGEPAVAYEHDEYIDLATRRKNDALRIGRQQDYSALVEKAFGRQVEKLLVDNDELAGERGWLAVVHADGNGFGRIVQKLGGDKVLFPKLSVGIDECTRDAFRDAVANMFSEQDIIPIRPLVLSGDDVTFICRGDIALEFTDRFLECFETMTKERMSEFAKESEQYADLLSSGLTACAGIAFMKPSYPFFYAYDLAESLCHAAKVDTKAKSSGQVPNSCLMFYKIQDSVIYDWKNMAERELGYKGGTFLFGPYYTEKVFDDRWTVADLLNVSMSLKSNNNIKTAVRKWISLMYSDTGKAEQYAERVRLVNGARASELFAKVTVHEGERCPAYDVLTCVTLSK